MFDARHTPVIVNRSARRILELRDGFTIERGRPRLANRSEDGVFQTLLAKACEAALKGRRAAGDVMQVSRPSGRRSFALMVAPLLDAPPGSAAGEAVSVAFIGNPDTGPVTTTEVLEQLYTLTRAEAELVRMLSEGRSLEQVATARGVTMNTVRSQLKQVFSKTDTKRQGELVRLVLTGVILAPRLMAMARNLTASIAARLRNDILGGTYKAGERLPAERDLASRLGVNRGSVREALKTLEQMGLVMIRRGDGATVRHLHEASIEIVRHLLIVNGVVNRRLLEQVLDAHEMLVAGAAHLAVERGSSEDHQRARELLRQLTRPGLSDGERVALFDALVELITQASGNLVLQLVRNVIRPALAERMALVQRRLAGEARGLAARVAAIDAAIEAGDAAATAAAVRSLVRDRREQLLAALDAIEAESGPSAARDPGPATRSA